MFKHLGKYLGQIFYIRMQNGLYLVIWRCVILNWHFLIRDMAKQAFRYVTLHEKTKHIALKMIFELRRLLPTATFELVFQQIWSL